MRKNVFYKISKEDLQELYWSKGLTLREIGRRKEVYHTTILKYMRRCGIPRRPLHACRQVSLQIDEHLAYVFGALCGDACFSRDHRTNKYWIQLFCKDKDFAESFSHHLTKVFTRFYHPVKPRYYGKREYYTVQAYVPKLTTQFFLKHPTGTKNWGVSNFIKNGNDELVVNFLRGFADAEGSVCLYTTRGTGYIELCSINKKGLEQVRSLLRRLGLTHGKLPIYKTTLRVHACLDLELFLDKIGFSISRKQERLIRFLKGYKTQRCIGRKPSRETLYNFYWVKGWSQREIAEKLEVHRKTVGRWVMREGIPTRSPPFYLKIKGSAHRGIILSPSLPMLEE